MKAEVVVMIIFAVGILVALAVSLLTIVLRQVREGDITWWSPTGRRRPPEEERRSTSEGPRPAERAEEHTEERAGKVRTGATRGRFR